MQAETAHLPPSSFDKRGFVRCTLCNASQFECRVMLAAKPPDIFICNGCVKAMSEMVVQQLENLCSAIH